MQAAWWAARGYFHKNDEAYWIRKGVWKKPSEEKS
jgi:hypothetical protein